VNADHRWIELIEADVFGLFEADRQAVIAL
jgi:hypothetical protein